MNTAQIKRMSNSELKAYKRMLKRRIVLRRRFLAFVIAGMLVLCFTLSVKSLITKANNSDENNMKYKYYTSVTVCYGDTVWDVAKDYIDYSKYQNMETYLKEVRKINHLNDDYDIVAGEKLIMPYYSLVYTK